MKFDRLMTWRFATAPATLKSLHRGPETPDWLVLVPRALGGADLHEAIQRRSMQVFRYETPDGDTVYVGTSRPDPIARPSVLAATHSRLK